MQKNHIPNSEDNLFFKGNKREKKEKEKTPSDEPNQASVYLVHCAESKTEVGTIG
jgi:hypothetical protein